MPRARSPAHPVVGGAPVQQRPSSRNGSPQASPHSLPVAVNTRRRRRQGDDAVIPPPPPLPHASPPATSEDHVQSPSDSNGSRSRWRIAQRGVERPTVSDSDLRLGAAHVLDALNGRLESGIAAMHGRSRTTRAMFFLQTHALWSLAVAMATMVHCSLLLLPPMSGGDRAAVAEVLCLTTYAADISLKMGYMGSRRYFSKRWQQLYVAIVATLVLDLVVRGASGRSPWLLRLARAGRPLVAVVRHRMVRRFFDAAARVSVEASPVLVTAAAFILTMGAVGSRLFGNVVEALQGGTLTATRELLTLVLSLDNFEKLAPFQSGVFADVDPTLVGPVTPEPPPHWLSRALALAYWCFFSTVTLVGICYLVQLLLVVTILQFGAMTKRQLQSERRKELQALTKAFAVVGTLATSVGDGASDQRRMRLDRTTWHRLYRLLRPPPPWAVTPSPGSAGPQTGPVTPAAAYWWSSELYYELLSNGQGDVDAIDFLRLRYVLSADFNLGETHEGAQAAGAHAKESMEAQGAHSRGRAFVSEARGAALRAARWAERIVVGRGSGAFLWLEIIVLTLDWDVHGAAAAPGRPAAPVAASPASVTRQNG